MRTIRLSRWPLAALLALAACSPVAALLGLAACSPSADPPPAVTAHDGADADGAGAAAKTPTAAAGDPAESPGLQDPLAGTWYALAPSHPYLALRLSLLGTEDEHALHGHWISFDWRATKTPEALVRRSKPVLVLVTRTGTPVQPGTLVVDGAMPMLDENGMPNGQNGTWRIELMPANLPGEPLRFRGRGVHSTLTGEEGVDVDLVRDFRVWTP